MANKKLFYCAIVLVICLSSCIGTFIGKHSLSSDTFIENVEALSQDESNPGSLFWPCWSQTTFIKGSTTWLCGSPCIIVEDALGTAGQSKCYANDQ